MECSECKKRPANLYFTQIINGKKREIHVCEVCAKQKGYMAYGEESYSLHDLLKGLFDFNSPQIGMQSEQLFKQEEVHCPKCNLSFRDFQRIGKFGCAQCYNTFVAKLDSIFRRVHSGNTVHNGKIPKRKGGILHQKKELEEYRKELQYLIEREEFEQAAIVRDKIKRLEMNEDGKDGDMS